VNRDNILRGLISRILSEYRDINSKIFLVLSDLQMVENIRSNKDEDNGENNYKKSFLLMRRSISITSFEKEQNGIDDVDDNNKNRNNVNYRQEEDEKIRKDQPSTKRRKPFRSAVRAW
jgi:hypothetical protein